MASVFASTTLSSSVIQSLASTIAGASVPPTWAVIDAALVGGERIRSISRRKGWVVAEGYAGSDLAAFGDAGVVLVSLLHEISARVAQISELLELAGPATAVSWLSTDAELKALQELCNYLGLASIQERKQPVHCRFADTRVLPVMLEQLSAGQSVRLQSVVKRWAWVNRQGQYACWAPNAVASGTPDSHPYLQLTIGQFREIRAGAEADGIFTLLWEQTPSLVPQEMQRGDFHLRLVRILQTASRFNINDLKSRLQFAVLSLSCGEEFHALQNLQPTWEGVHAGEYLLIDKMRLWGNGIWAELEHRRPEDERGILP